MLLPLILNLQEGAVVEPEPEVAADVIRNFSSRDDRYDWLRQHRKEENEAEDLRAEIVQVSVELEERIERAVDEPAELAARMQLQMAREHYLSTFENAYREDMRDALIEQWREEISYQKYLAQVKRRAALLLLLAH